MRSTRRAISGAAARARSPASAALDGSKMESDQDQEIRLHLWQRHELGPPLFRRRRLAAGRHGDLDRKTGEVFEPETSPNSGPARGEFDPAGNYWAAGRGGSLIKFDIKEQARPRISAADALHLALHRQGRQERRGLGRRAQRRALSALRSEDRAVHRLHAARALRHGPRVLDRQFHQPGLGLVRRSRRLAGAHPAAGLKGAQPAGRDWRGAIQRIAPPAGSERLQSRPETWHSATSAPKARAPSRRRSDEACPRSGRMIMEDADDPDR